MSTYTVEEVRFWMRFLGQHKAWQALRTYIEEVKRNAPREVVREVFYIKDDDK